MILFEPTTPKSRRQTGPSILLFGVGLIGNAIRERIARRAAHTEHRTLSAWDEAGGLENHRDGIRRAIASTDATRPLEIIWSAGRAGFGVNEEDAGRELESFKTHLDLLEQESKAVGVDINFRLISSAGGLFEGQKLVCHDTPPDPRRPYGRMKLEMERQLQDRSFPLKRVLRVTSVFGHVRPGQRLGLVTTLIVNGLRQLPTPIYGTAGTLRDFIFADDIARYLIRELNASESQKGFKATMLAAGKPSSIGEIIHLVEGALKRRLLLQCSLDPDNFAHITYRSQPYPSGFQTTSLPAAIQTILGDFRSRS